MSYFNSGGTGAHHTSPRGVHLGEVVEGQDVAGLRGQVEELERLLVIALHTDAIWRAGLTARTKNEEIGGCEDTHIMKRLPRRTNTARAGPQHSL